MDQRERTWIDDGWAAIFGPWIAPTLQQETEDRAAHLTSPFGRRPATDYGWGDDDEEPLADWDAESDQTTGIEDTGESER